MDARNHSPWYAASSPAPYATRAPTPAAQTHASTHSNGLPSSTHGLPAKPLPPMFAYGLPKKPESSGLPPRSAAMATSEPKPKGGPQVGLSALLPTDRLPSLPPLPSAFPPRPPRTIAIVAAPPPRADDIPGVVGKADINIWNKPFKHGAEDPEIDLQDRKRAREEEESTPATALSLEKTTLVAQPFKTYAPDDPIPVLPPPLPSKRAKKGGASTAVLLPVEKLPVFSLPSLPPITDPDLLKQVFTHHSVFPRSRGQFEEPDGHGHYEKLEHVGDSILGMVVTTWLHELKPGLTCGTATKLKAHLVSNATLSHISGMYNFPQRLNGDPRLLPVLRAQTDVRAALVEAYIAGLYFSFPPATRLSEGMACVTGWLREMYDPLYDFFLQHMQHEYKQHYSVMGTAYDGTVQVAASPDELDRLDTFAEGMTLLVKSYGQNAGRVVEYESERFETSVGILWRLRLLVDGIEMGDATRSSRYRARNAAAWDAAKKLGLTTGAVTINTTTP